MDRNIVYPGAIPLDTDPLSTNRNAMVALGGMLAAVLGSSIVADGLAVTPTGPASMSVVVAGGSITLLTTVDGSAYGSLTSSTDPLVKMGINTASTTLGPLTAPGTSGQSIVYLIQAAFNEADDTPVALPYYNASNPSIPYSGPGNSGATQNTRRRQSVALSAKAGVAATTGSQVAPSPDSGYVGLYDVTIAYGASSIISGNIAVHAGAPFLSMKLPAVANNFGSLLTTNGWKKYPDPNSPTGCFIEQWGAAVFPNSGTRTSALTVTLPIAFPNALVAADCQPNGGANSSLGGQPSCGYTATTLSSVSFLADTLGYTTFNQTLSFHYTAKGY